MHAYELCGYVSYNRLSLGINYIQIVINVTMNNLFNNWEYGKKRNLNPRM